MESSSFLRTKWPNGGGFPLPLFTFTITRLAILPLIGAWLALILLVTIFEPLASFYDKVLVTFMTVYSWEGERPWVTYPCLCIHSLIWRKRFTLWFVWKYLVWVIHSIIEKVTCFKEYFTLYLWCYCFMLVLWMEFNVLCFLLWRETLNTNVLFICMSVVSGNPLCQGVHMA